MGSNLKVQPFVLFLYIKKGAYLIFFKVNLIFLVEYVEFVDFGIFSFSQRKNMVLLLQFLLQNLKALCTSLCQEMVSFAKAAQFQHAVKPVVLL